MNGYPSGAAGPGAFNPAMMQQQMMAFQQQQAQAQGGGCPQMFFPGMPGAAAGMSGVPGMNMAPDLQQQQQMMLMMQQQQQAQQQQMQQPQPQLQQQSSESSEMRQAFLKVTESLSDVEREYYTRLWQAAGCVGGQALGGKAAFDFLSKSHLPKEILKRIWDLADWQKRHTLGWEEFVVTLKLISAAQKKQLVSLDRVLETSGPTSRDCPKFDGIEGPADGGEAAMQEAPPVRKDVFAEFESLAPQAAVAPSPAEFMPMETAPVSAAGLSATGPVLMEDFTSASAAAAPPASTACGACGGSVEGPSMPGPATGCSGSGLSSMGAGGGCSDLSGGCGGCGSSGSCGGGCGPQGSWDAFGEAEFSQAQPSTVTAVAAQQQEDTEKSQKPWDAFGDMGNQAATMTPPAASSSGNAAGIEEWSAFGTQASEAAVTAAPAASSSGAAEEWSAFGAQASEASTMPAPAESSSGTAAGNEGWSAFGAEASEVTVPALPSPGVIQAEDEDWGDFGSQAAPGPASSSSGGPSGPQEEWSAFGSKAVPAVEGAAKNEDWDAFSTSEPAPAAQAEEWNAFGGSQAPSSGTVVADSSWAAFDSAPATAAPSSAAPGQGDLWSKMSAFDDLLKEDDHLGGAGAAVELGEALAAAPPAAVPAAADAGSGDDEFGDFGGAPVEEAKTSAKADLMDDGLPDFASSTPEPKAGDGPANSVGNFTSFDADFGLGVPKAEESKQGATPIDLFGEFDSAPEPVGASASSTANFAAFDADFGDFDSAAPVLSASEASSSLAASKVDMGMPKADAPDAAGNGIGVDDGDDDDFGDFGGAVGSRSAASSSPKAAEDADAFAAFPPVSSGAGSGAAASALSTNIGAEDPTVGSAAFATGIKAESQGSAADWAAFDFDAPAAAVPASDGGAQQLKAESPPVELFDAFNDFAGPPSSASTAKAEVEAPAVRATQKADAWAALDFDVATPSQPSEARGAVSAGHLFSAPVRLEQELAADEPLEGPSGEARSLTRSLIGLGRFEEALQCQANEEVLRRLDEAEARKKEAVAQDDFEGAIQIRTEIKALSSELAAESVQESWRRLAASGEQDSSLELAAERLKERCQWMDDAVSSTALGAAVGNFRRACPRTSTNLSLLPGLVRQQRRARQMCRAIEAVSSTNVLRFLQIIVVCITGLCELLGECAEQISRLASPDWSEEEREGALESEELQSLLRGLSAARRVLWRMSLGADLFLLPDSDSDYSSDADSSETAKLRELQVSAGSSLAEAKAAWARLESEVVGLRLQLEPWREANCFEAGGCPAAGCSVAEQQRSAPLCRLCLLPAVPLGSEAEIEAQDPGAVSAPWRGGHWHVQCANFWLRHGATSKAFKELGIDDPFAAPSS
eukprot:TRINITY_DN25051_c0_g1_i2.p1 TRINITY_DN25051_c0_g1~~TRINITY_DN25051_c0_g1_i2.p1  ORF type:complete len:1375 (-),score=447.93 TRINITY_DN25051_c0_g1_i2:58-4182(-)